MYVDGQIIADVLDQLSGKVESNAGGFTRWLIAMGLMVIGIVLAFVIVKILTHQP